MLLADRVLFIDAEAMIVDKPAGLPVDPPRDGSLSVVNHLDGLRFNFARLPLPVHRLDRDTSGCLLLARNPRSHKHFQLAFEQGAVTKTYVAVLEGIPVEESGRIDLALSKVSTAKDGWRMVPDPRGKASVTNWQVVGTAEGRALVLFTPETGRTHQLRVHAASAIGIAIAGDPVYGRSEGPMLLHAYSLSVPRERRTPVAAVAPLPPAFTERGFAYG